MGYKFYALDGQTYFYIWDLLLAWLIVILSSLFVVFWIQPDTWVKQIDAELVFMVKMTVPDNTRNVSTIGTNPVLFSAKDSQLGQLSQLKVPKTEFIN